MKTYASEINETLQKHGRCILPGIGLLEIIHYPAERSFHDNTLQPPSFEINLSPVYYAEEKGGSIIEQIASSQSLTKEEAAKRWKDTAEAIREKLSTGSSVPLEGLGWLNLDEEGQITFVSSLKPSLFYQPVSLKPPRESAPDTKENIPPAPAPVPASVPVNENIPEEEKTISLDQKQSRARWWIIGSILALLLIGWFTYRGTKERKEKKAAIKEIITAQATDSQGVRFDSIQQSIDSMRIAHQASNDSIHYKIVFATYDNKNKAEHQYHKLRGWGHPVEMLVKDSTQYELAWPFTSLPIDTIVNLVKMMNLYGKDVHIEYGNK